MCCLVFILETFDYALYNETPLAERHVVVQCVTAM